jgi:DNA-binding winged helix-turn-helix (wHTH) protein/TolB-like protein
VWRFAECSFDELRHELRVRDRIVETEAKPLEVLHQLLLHAGAVVRKEDLLDAVWPGVLVVDASLATAVSKLRKVLGDNEAIIKTVPKVGYRLAIPVRCDFRAEAVGLTSQPLPFPVGAAPQPVEPTSRARGSAYVPRWRAIGLAAAVVAGLALLGLTVGLAALRKVLKPNRVPGPVAILPFQNAGSSASLDYLRSALPDQVATTLSAARSLPIRPLVATSRYSDPSMDLRKVARELDVKRIITGRYVQVGEQLQITMEAVDTEENRVLWRDTVNVPANSLLAMQEQLAAISHGKLASALGITDFVKASEPAPTNEEAYGLYLRSMALEWDPVPNRQGIELLRRSVLLDPSYPPAWGALSLRYYAEARRGGGGPAILQLSDAAAERQLALDPGSPDPVAELTLHRAERGDLVKAHQQAVELVRRRPDNANNHHVLNYVLRYGGSLEEAGRECDMVVLLASKMVWGSCAITFMELGSYSRAKDFIRKDLSSEWSKAYAVEVLLREGKTQEAIKIGPPQIPHWGSYRMLLACAQQQPESQIKALATGVEVDDDPEVNYFFAGHLAYCGRTTEALRLLKLAIDGNYCSYPTMDLDPFFGKMRAVPEFAKVRAAGMSCHENFIANREPDHKIVASRR